MRTRIKPWSTEVMKIIFHWQSCEKYTKVWQLSKVHFKKGYIVPAEHTSSTVLVLFEIIVSTISQERAGE